MGGRQRGGAGPAKQTDYGIDWDKDCNQVPATTQIGRKEGRQGGRERGSRKRKKSDRQIYKKLSGRMDKYFLGAGQDQSL